MPKHSFDHLTVKKRVKSLTMEEYSPLVWSLVSEIVHDLADDAIGLAKWKKSRPTLSPHYGTGAFPSDSGFPLSTFSSTPNTSKSTSPETPTFRQLEGEGISDEEVESQANAAPPRPKHN